MQEMKSLKRRGITGDHLFLQQLEEGIDTIQSEPICGVTDIHGLVLRVELPLKHVSKSAAALQS